jgi:predicted transcriptional regulator
LPKYLNNKTTEIIEKDSQFMNLIKIIKLANGHLLTPDIDIDIEINGGYGADLMSDVLAFSQPDSVLITGLTNPQVVRTAEMAEFRAIIFVRGKQPQAETLQIAMQENIPLITSPFGMFELSGRLHQAGLPSFESNESN